MLDLADTGPDESIILCPANHAPPILVTAHPGAAGYEAVAMCLATPDIRAPYRRCHRHAAAGLTVRRPPTGRTAPMAPGEEAVDPRGRCGR
jgi:hypothetical protein